MVTTLVADKVTKGTVRFTEPDVPEDERPLSIYLPKAVVENLSFPVIIETQDDLDGTQAVKLTIERA